MALRYNTYERKNMYEVLFFIQFIGVIIGFANLIIVGVQKSSENQKILFIASACAFVTAQLEAP